MKKAINIISLVTAFIIISGCNSFSSTVKEVNDCCKGLVETCSKAGVVNGSEEEKNKTSEFEKGASLLPLNSWDAKMMIW